MPFVRSSIAMLAVGGAVTAVSATAHAEQQQPQPPPILTHVEEPTGPNAGGVNDAPLGAPRGAPRSFAITYNPLTINLERISLNLEVVPVSHHALVLTGFYATTTTNEDSFNNKFRGFGGEIGYRHYSGEGGPRGLYFGPSLLVGYYDAIPMNGARTHFGNFGLAFDVGYQAIVADRWVVGLGGGIQYSAPTHEFPKQELPASVYTQPGLRLRLLLSLGVAFD